MTEPLRECPAGHNKVELQRIQSGALRGYYRGRCTKNCGWLGALRKDMNEAITAWNERATDARIAKLEAALRDIRDNYDCEVVGPTREGHQPNTCRCCIAQEALGADK